MYGASCNKTSPILIGRSAAGHSLGHWAPSAESGLQGICRQPAVNWNPVHGGTCGLSQVQEPTNCYRQHQWTTPARGRLLITAGAVTGA